MQSPDSMWNKCLSIHADEAVKCVMDNKMIATVDVLLPYIVLWFSLISVVNIFSTHNTFL